MEHSSDARHHRDDCLNVCCGTGAERAGDFHGGSGFTSLAASDAVTAPFISCAFASRSFGSIERG
jgi:hypothetical protein